MKAPIKASSLLLPSLLLLLVPAALAAQESRHSVRTKVIVLGDDSGEQNWSARHDPDLQCFEEGTQKVCVAHATRHGEAVMRGFLGVHLTAMTPELRAHMGAPDDAGVLISKVEEDSPAALAGLEVGDVVTAVDQESVGSTRELQHAIASRADGDLATLEIYRDGRLEQITATLGVREGHSMHGSMRLHGLGGDLEKVLEHVHESMSELDFDFDFDFGEPGAKIHESLSAIDWEAIKERVHAALSGLSQDDSE